MDTLRTLMRHLATSVASGDVDAAAGLFQDDGRIIVKDGEHALVTLPAREALDAAMAAFSDVAYSPVLHQAGDSFGDDGVLTATHRSTFLGCPPSARRVYLNVHLSAAQAGGGLLSDVTVGTSVAALRHQLAGGGNALAVADGLTAEVRHRLWSAPPSVDDSKAAIGSGSEAKVGDVTPARRGRQRKGVAVVIVAFVVIALAAFGAVAVLLPNLRRDDALRPTPQLASKSAAPQAGASAGPPPSAFTSSASAPRTTAPSTPTTSAGAPVIVTATGQPQVQPGRQVVLPSDVLFAVDSAQLSPQTQNALSDLAHHILVAHVTGQIQINGYTDNLGSAAHGLELSRQRAVTVAQALQGALAGVPVTLLPPGFRDADPIADNNTDQGRARNRRVTIVLPATSP